MFTKIPNFLIDVFCKDTIVGLSNIGEQSDIENKFKKKNKNMRLYKNAYSELFNIEKSNDKKFETTFIDPIAYHLLKDVQNRKALCSV